MAVLHAFRPNMAPATDTPLYTSNRLRKWLAILLYTTVIYKTAIFILSIASAADYHPRYRFRDIDIVYVAA